MATYERTQGREANTVANGHAGRYRDDARQSQRQNPQDARDAGRARWKLCDRASRRRPPTRWYFNLKRIDEVRVQDGRIDVRSGRYGTSVIMVKAAAAYLRTRIPDDTSAHPVCTS